MTEMKLPKSPAQAYRETSADVVAFKAGVALRIIWGEARQILKWTALLGVLSFVGIVYLIWQVLFGMMKR